MNSFIETSCTLSGLKHLIALSHHQQGNGQAENYNKPTSNVCVIMLSNTYVIGIYFFSQKLMPAIPKSTAQWEENRLAWCSYANHANYVHSFQRRPCRLTPTQKQCQKHLPSDCHPGLLKCDTTPTSERKPIRNDKKHIITPESEKRLDPMSVRWYKITARLCRYLMWTNWTW